METSNQMKIDRRFNDIYAIEKKDVLSSKFKDLRFLNENFVKIFYYA